jgi:hypothetical protein
LEPFTLVLDHGRRRIAFVPREERAARYDARAMHKPLLLLALAALSHPPAAQSANPWTVGAPVPELELPTIDGGRLALSALRGKRVLLIEFASW